MYEYVNLSVVYYVCHIVFFLSITTIAESVEAKQLKSPDLFFKRRTVVQPIVHRARTKRAITSTRDTAGEHHKQVSVTVNVDGEEYVLDLSLNEYLVTRNHVISYQENGETVLRTPTKEELDICQYSGTVRSKPGSWVAVSTCRGISGVIHDGNSVKYIEPAGGHTIDALHFIYDHSVLNTTYQFGHNDFINRTGYDSQLVKNISEQRWNPKRFSRGKRKAYEDTEVRGPSNANKMSHYVELVLVADNREFRANGESVDTVHRQLKDVANIINSLYTPLNIFIVLVGVVIWNERDLIHIEENGDTTLDNFLEYRRSKLLRDIPNDNAHLITRQTFLGGVVGKAYVGAMCSYNQSAGIALNIGDNIGLLAATIAHEMGHNFNMQHDSADCDCPAQKCIMNASGTNIAPSRWSACSLRWLILGYEKGIDYCLRNKPERLFESPTCGNGFVEAGEQCDCGLAAVATGSRCAACCDPLTCTLRSNATCAVGACCDHTTCRPKPAGTVCRSAGRECDLPEYCSGHSEYCPADVHKMDATPCSNGQAYCARGTCRSHSYQCRHLWGPSGKNSDERCYVTNVEGKAHGHCGYMRVAGRLQYTPCKAADVMCGLLQCWQVGNGLQIGKLVASSVTFKDSGNGTIIHCNTASVDFGLSDVDPGLVPDGAKCGEDKMCLNQRCVSVASVKKRIARRKSVVCPSDCSGHGQCNSNGNCHCDDGFAPPSCDSPGPGGSLDSGPASDPSVLQSFKVAMYVIFLGVLPLVLLVLSVVYCLKCNEKLIWWNKTKRTCTTKMTGSIRIPQFISNLRKSTKEAIEIKHGNEENNLDICENKDNNKHAIQEPRQSWMERFIIHTEIKKSSIINFRKKLNKDDIRVIGNSSEMVVDTCTISVPKISSGEPNSPRIEKFVKSAKVQDSKQIMSNNHTASETNINKATTTNRIDNKVRLTSHNIHCNVSKGPDSSQRRTNNNTQLVQELNIKDNSELTPSKNVMSKDTTVKMNQDAGRSKSMNKRIAKSNSAVTTNITDTKIKFNHNKVTGHKFLNLPSETSNNRRDPINDTMKDSNNKENTAKSTTVSQVKHLLQKFEKNST